jgi:hypothetical protein
MYVKKERWKRKKKKRGRPRKQGSKINSDIALNKLFKR